MHAITFGCEADTPHSVARTAARNSMRACDAGLHPQSRAPNRDRQRLRAASSAALCVVAVHRASTAVFLPSLSAPHQYTTAIATHNSRHRTSIRQRVQVPMPAPHPHMAVLISHMWLPHRKTIARA
eukprot:2954723-Rhodomonas_salina.1